MQKTGEVDAFSLALLGVVRYQYSYAVVGQEESDVGSAEDDDGLCYAFERRSAGVLYELKRILPYLMRVHLIIVSEEENRMYDLINIHILSVLQTIPQNHVAEYDWLLQNVNQCPTAPYQARYKNYWRLNVARLSANYCNAYFQALQVAQANRPAVADLAQQLYATPTHRNGQQSLQFSFATKLLHMVAPSTPIYDSLVAAFYFWQEPARNLTLGQRVAAFAQFHIFLAQEYRRILQNNLLGVSIQGFRQQFNPQHFTDEKVVDSLLWAYVALLRNGGITDGTVIYC